MSISRFLRKRKVLYSIFVCSFVYFCYSTFGGRRNAAPYYSSADDPSAEENIAIGKGNLERILRLGGGRSLNAGRAEGGIGAHDAADKFAVAGKPLRSLNNAAGKGTAEGEEVRKKEEAKKEKGGEEGSSRPAGGAAEGAPTRCRNSVQGRSLLTDERGFVCNRFHVNWTGCCDVSANSTKKFNCESCEAESGCCQVYEHCVSCCLDPVNLSDLKTILEHRHANLHKVVSKVDDMFDLCLTQCRTSSVSVRHENTYRNSKLKFCYSFKNVTV